MTNESHMDPKISTSRLNMFTLFIKEYDEQESVSDVPIMVTYFIKLCKKMYFINITILISDFARI